MKWCWREKNNPHIFVKEEILGENIRPCNDEERDEMAQPYNNDLVILQHRPFHLEVPNEKTSSRFLRIFQVVSLVENSGNTVLNWFWIAEKSLKKLLVEMQKPEFSSFEPLQLRLWISAEKSSLKEVRLGGGAI